MKLLAKFLPRFHKEQAGVSLIEVLVSLAIFAAIGVALMNGLFTGNKSLEISQERTYAESLAKSQVEYIKAQEYVSTVKYDPGVLEYQIIDVPSHLALLGYTVELSAPAVVEAAGFSGYELQSIEIKVKHSGETILIVVFYRAGLAL